MWKKLSTEHKPTQETPLNWYQQQLGRAMRGGVKKGEVIVFAAHGKGYTRFDKKGAKIV